MGKSDEELAREKEIQKQMMKKRRARKSKKAKSKKPLSFPWWCKIIAYVLSFMFAFVSLFMVWIKGLLLGNDEVTKWVTSLVVSLFSGVLFTQPLQVAIIAFVFVTIFRAPGDEKDDLADNYCDERLAQLTVGAPVSKKGDENDQEGIAKMTIKELRNMKEIRYARMIEKKMYAKLLEIFIFALFLFFVAVVSAQNKDRNAYQYNTAMRNYFMGDMGGVEFEGINRVNDVWTWMQNVFKITFDCSKW